MPGGLALLIAGLIVASARADSGPKVNYNRDIRPILSDNCFACHGPDASKRKAGLRLDTPEGALAELESGSRAIVPGNPDESELIARITAEEDSIRMPPPKARKTLKPEQIDLLRRWIEQGAPMETHWAFLAPQRPALPEVSDPTWPRTPIDRFLLARLDAEGLKPSPEADKRTLIRRVTLDLTGLPPTLAEVEAFLADNAPDAYEHLVERLLRSPRYGEHMARFWLDAARYGDTHGLHLDNYREIWPYREWVIQAFNRNLPYDQFLIEQLAGDMLPDATLDQKIASGFNRCHVTTSEGGSIAEEVYVRNVLDRVETTGTVFLGLTIGCARCHDHKYDPVKMKDFYGLFAFFNSLDDDPLDRNAKAHPPVVQVPTEEQKKALEQLDQKIAALKKTIAETVAQATYDESADAEQGEYVRREDFVYIDDALPPGAVTKPDTGFTLVEGPDHPVLSGTKAIRRTADQLGQSYFVNAGRKLRVGEGDTLFAYVFLDPTNPPKEVMLQWRVGDWKHRAYWGENLIDSGKDGTGERLRVGPLPTTGEWVRLEVPAARLGLKPGTLIDGWAFAQHGG
ncbi:MAG: DUF1549 domain-containing protein, partial [Isosphaeraceae bacterium]|nr:DUF1549 domain-containing protein [Isosphaeraceae bacterium]